ncbi:hypothetical protein IWQ60_000633 [Tieghemiomyces parasiticus]|uniref:Velvet domain-containing protein n=1 Tax=Tieghemiomyces parasiticus TaxID=78921 RepID=A0A9W8E2P0_9FUNG|nr:hypothetical protein IWQ60_000633 [Tieghemiomyces parasiticus]
MAAGLSPDALSGLASFLRSRPQYEDYRFDLQIVQQPIRARMCGFGDKDRRPCTPPPILKLIAYDKAGRPVDPSTIDTSFLVVHADLWSADGKAQQNLVLHPSLASTGGTILDGADDDRGAPPAVGPSPQPSAVGTTPPQRPGLLPPGKAMETRNLIGSPATSACKLYDTENRLGIFFIFQDLSVRTEGNFRLRFSFVDIGTSDNQLTMGQDCVRQVVLSDVFTVYSAKKFPGMIESTPLSKCFVKQGIKISVRRESTKSSGKEPDDME